MGENEEKLRSALREHAIRLDHRIGRIHCHQCQGGWSPGEAEDHHGNCLAAPLPRYHAPGYGSDATLREALVAWEIPWPEPDPTEERGPKERCSKLVKINRRAQYQDHFNPFPPSVPSRTVTVDTEEDFLIGDGDYAGNGHARTLTDEEWAAALAAYEKAKESYARTGGHYREKTGPDIIEATFILENGGHAFALWSESGKVWAFREWSSDPLSA